MGRRMRRQWALLLAGQRARATQRHALRRLQQQYKPAKQQYKPAPRACVSLNTKEHMPSTSSSICVWAACASITTSPALNCTRRDRFSDCRAGGGEQEVRKGGGSASEGPPPPRAASAPAAHVAWPSHRRLIHASAPHPQPTHRVHLEAVHAGAAHEEAPHLLLLLTVEGDAALVPQQLAQGPAVKKQVQAGPAHEAHERRGQGACMRARRRRQRRRHGRGHACPAAAPHYATPPSWPPPRPGSDARLPPRLLPAACRLCAVACAVTWQHPTHPPDDAIQGDVARVVDVRPQRGAGAAVCEDPGVGQEQADADDQQAAGG